jgi:hypothetical protein
MPVAQPKETRVKMNLSRAAKKFRTQIAQEPEALKSTRAKGVRTQPAPEPVLTAPPPAPEPLPEPIVPVAPTPATPKKVWPVKAKRPRFVRVQVERRERSAAPALPPRSTKLSARLLTRNLAFPPKDEFKLPR